MSEILYPVGIQNFEKLREGGFVYVDKTRHIYDLAHNGHYYFLGRPRRFGKSLLISTMEAYFLGKRKLFEGLALERLEKEWAAHPVLHLDLNTADYNKDDSLETVLNNALCVWEKEYGTMSSEASLPLRFSGIIERAAKKTGRKTVILVDEYDKPLLQTFGDERLQDSHRAMLKAFYSVLKTQDQYIRFAFLTGVTKFGKVSVFSDLNNLKDISMMERYIDICGITEPEIHRYFEPALHETAAANGMTYEQACARLKDQYDGYRFEVNTPGIYNPFSLLNALQERKFKNYWFETGTPTFLVELLKRHGYRLENLTKERLASDALNSMEPPSGNPVPMIYQSGYLTIKGYMEQFGKYLLGFPNKEVEQGFINFLLPAYVPVRNTTEFDISYFVEDVQTGDAEGFMERLQAFFADVDYKIIGDAEKYFHNAMFLIFKMMGFYTEAEYNTSHGSIDILVKTDGYVYIIECKLDRSAAEALEQIERKQYAAPFAADGRKLYKIGISFSSGIRGISEYIIQ